MTTQTDMIELAKRRAGLKRKAFQEAARRAAIDTSTIYLTVKEISESYGLSLDQVRYRLRSIEPVKVPAVGGITSYAYGYSTETVKVMFNNLNSN